jgi:uncharacterized protein (TIGR01777 family)
MTPPWEQVRLISSTGGIQVGARIELLMRMGPVPVRWVALHDRYEEPRMFRDIQLRGPFARWEHEHRFEAVPGGAALTDHVAYELPLPPFGSWFGGGFARATLERTFRYRHALLGLDLERHSRYQARGPRRFALSGADGVVGTALWAFLSTGGHSVVRITDETPPDEIEGADGVIYLRANGESDADRLRLLSDQLAGMKRRPGVLIGVGDLTAFGDRGAEEGDEHSAPAADLARAWEVATAPAKAAGIRIVHLRTGTVLTPSGGVLRRLLPWFSVGLGGRLGTGDQELSWISLEDLLGVIQFAAFEEALVGPVDAIAPGNVSGLEFGRTLGRVLGHPMLVPFSAKRLSSVVGGCEAVALLARRRVVPRVLREYGFSFRFPDLEGALRFMLGKSLE